MYHHSWIGTGKAACVKDGGGVAFFLSPVFPNGVSWVWGW
jgi:hypothetical protein